MTKRAREPSTLNVAVWVASTYAMEAAACVVMAGLYLTTLPGRLARWRRRG